MKQLLVFIMVLMLVSCQYFDIEKTSSEAILNEELKTFNWSDVDEYPTFSLCDSLLTKKEKKDCFEYELTMTIFDFLKDQDIEVTRDVHDTINLSFEISETGNLSLSDFKVDSIIIYEIPNIKSLIHQSLDSLPQIFPAIKRGQQVTTQFQLPIIISVE